MVLLFLNQFYNKMQHNVIFIRHAQSMINKATIAVVLKYGIPNSYEYLRKYPEWTNDIKYSMDFVDCPITQLGRQQCLSARKKADQLKPDVILVSPLERALETCYILFGGRNIPTIVQPILTQSIRSSCDLCGEIEQKIHKFPQFNFSNVPKNGNNWLFQLDEQHKQQYFKKINQSDCKSIKQKNKAVLEYMAETASYQKPKNMRARSLKVKQMLKKYSQHYNQIVVVAHFNTINYTVAEQFTEQNEPKNSIKIGNCQFHYTNINQMLKMQ